MYIFIVSIKSEKEGKEGQWERRREGSTAEIK